MKRAFAVLVLLFLAFVATGCTFFLGDTQLWPPQPRLTGRWEGSQTWLVDPPESQVETEVDLVVIFIEDSKGNLSGTFSYTWTLEPDSPRRMTDAFFGAHNGNDVSFIVGFREFTGILIDGSLAGVFTTYERTSSGVWQLVKIN